MPIDPLAPNAPIRTDDDVEDRARDARRVADLIADDLDDPSTPSHLDPATGEPAGFEVALRLFDPDADVEGNDDAG